MSNLATLKPFKKGKDPRRNTTGLNKGALSMTTKIKEFLMEFNKDGESNADKLKRAIVMRAIVKSDVMAKEILDRVDGKVVDKQETDLTVNIKDISDGYKQLIEKVKNES